jgi:hypothetical protein
MKVGKKQTGRRTTAERFKSKVRISPSCHTWQGARQGSGIGFFYLRGRLVTAHRASYELHIGPVPTGAYVVQKCTNRACVRPDHLSIGTRDEHLAILRSNREPGSIRRGEERNGAKLTADDIRKIRSRYATQGCTLKLLAQEFDVSLGLIHQIVRRKKWAHVA